MLCENRLSVVTASRTRDLLSWTRLRKLPNSVGTKAIEVSTPAGDLFVRAFRVNHWGARLQYDDYRGYNGYVIERNGRRVHLCGRYSLHERLRIFAGRRSVRARHHGIGAYQPWIRTHCTPEQAIRMADMAEARFIMPVHHQTFKLSFEPFHEPIERFVSALAASPSGLRSRRLAKHSFFLSKPSADSRHSVSQCRHRGSEEWHCSCFMVIMAKLLNTSAANYYLEEIIRLANDRLVLITPLLKFNDHLKELLEDKNRTKVDIRLLFGKNRASARGNYLASRSPFYPDQLLPQSSRKMLSQSGPLHCHQPEPARFHPGQ